LPHRFPHNRRPLRCASLHDTDCPFPDLFDKPVVARFDQPHGVPTAARFSLKAGTDGSVSPPGWRPVSDAGKSVRSITRSRPCFGSASRDRLRLCRLHDAARLADDPIHKMLVGREPIDAISLLAAHALAFPRTPSPRTACFACEGPGRDRRRNSPTKAQRQGEADHDRARSTDDRPRGTAALSFQRPLRHVGAISPSSAS